MNCVRFAHMTLAALDELLTPKVGTGVEHLILTNESVKASLQTALL